eukprot:15480789-Alexandrium_andersonii.AAC.1
MRALDGAGSVENPTRRPYARRNLKWPLETDKPIKAAPCPAGVASACLALHQIPPIWPYPKRSPAFRRFLNSRGGPRKSCATPLM